MQSYTIFFKFPKSDNGVFVRKEKEQNLLYTNRISKIQLTNKIQQPLIDYPILDDLISGWFHQDFFIEGKTIEDIIGAYNV